MRKWKYRPYCCTMEEWLNANYGISLDDIPFCVCRSYEHCNRVYDILKKRHPTSKWAMHTKTKGVY